MDRTKVAEGHKASFCLEDNDCEGDADRQYDCDRTGGGEQGISMGCADTYLYTLGKLPIIELYCHKACGTSDTAL